MKAEEAEGRHVLENRCPSFDEYPVRKFDGGIPSLLFQISLV